MYYYMRYINRLFLVCLSAVCTVFVITADNYVQRLSEKGHIFHMFSKKMPSGVRNQKPKAIEYDYTYVEMPDSVSLLLTVELPAAYKPTEVEFQTCDTVYNYRSDLIYADPKGKGYKCRIKTMFPFCDWQRIYLCENPFVLILKFQSGTSRISYSFGFPAKHWEKERNEIAKFQDIIRLNTGK